MKENKRNTRRQFMRVNVVASDGTFRAYLEGSMHNIVRFVRSTYPGCKLEVVR